MRAIPKYIVAGDVFVSGRYGAEGCCLLRCPYMYESGWRVRLGALDSGARLGYIYRVIQEESAILWEMIVCVILSKKVHMNVGLILNCYGVMTA
jgi:hypothetical protein